MRNILILLVISLAACTPTPTTPTLIGTWYGTDEYYRGMVFTCDSANVTGQPRYPYHATDDSIYLVMSDGSLYPQYGYMLSATTLRLYPTLHYPSPLVFTR